ncbi:efflux RND transporter periplasmic adaptor subunit [Sporolactobacillus pectinivorans]|uniref:efflux RND transporter periplasmic adaptor subunit n=1 Tax=Sporolactobacillus pectinivorans TaxID=1591408 RepID=UPI000C258A4E|nr:efflux RND transporter periplasmic adaptor subunit [Sporolactobacillus pectinivorans]
MKRVWITIIVLILIVGGGAFWFLTQNKSAAAQVLYPTTTVQKGTIETDVSGSGDLVPATDEDITIGSGDASKTISTVDVAANDTVKQGAALLTYTDGTTLDAPAAGTITTVNAYAGQRVTVGRAVMHLTNYSDLNTVLQIDELDIPKVKDGQNVAVTVNAYPSKTFSGTVTSIAAEGTDTNGVSTFNVTVHLNSSSGLKPGMTTTGNIVLQKKANVLYLPTGAVHQAGNQSYVYLSSNTASQSQQSGFGRRRLMNMDTKQGSMVAVKTGISNDQSIEITSGLTAGQSVQLTAITRQSGTNSTSNSQSSYGMMSGFGGGQGFGGGRGFGGGGGRGFGSGTGTGGGQGSQMGNGGGNGQ